MEHPVTTLESVRDHFDATGQFQRMANVDYVIGRLMTSRNGKGPLLTTGGHAAEPDIPRHWWWFAAGVLCGGAGSAVHLLATYVT